MKKLLFVFMIMMLVSICYAEDTPAIRNQTTGIVYNEIEYNTAAIEATSGDEFDIGIINDTGEFINTNNSNSIENYILEQEYTRESIYNKNPLYRGLKYTTNKFVYSYILYYEESPPHQINSRVNYLEAK